MRLLHFSTVFRSDAAPLQCMLRLLGRDGRIASPWMKMVQADLKALKHAVSPKLDELPDPDENVGPWIDLAVDWPTQWAMLVKRLHFSDSSFDAASVDAAQ
eukprot:7367974-Karenia_brevis.AAC.1